MKRGMRLCVTGAHGTPVYAMGNINEATVEEEEEEEETKCKVLRLENFENVPRPSSVVDIENAELWIGEKSKGAVRFADDHSMARRIEKVDANYLEFMCRWYQNQFTFIDLAYQVGPFTAQEAEHLEHFCNRSSFDTSTYQRA